MANIKFNLPLISSIVIYCRVSSAKQADDKHTGLNTQKNICLKYIENNEEYKNIEIFLIEEIGSSYNNQNALTKLDKLLETMKKNTLILIHDTSRFGRNIYQTNRDCEKVELKNSYIISVMELICFGLSRITDQTFFQKLSDAEMFSNIQSERAKNRCKIAKENGEYVGRAPFGKMVIKDDNNKRVLVDKPDEAHIISIIKNLINDNISIYRINRDLIQTKALGQEWSLSKLKRIINKNMTRIEINKINYEIEDLQNSKKKRKNLFEEFDTGIIDNVNKSFKNTLNI